MESNLHGIADALGQVIQEKSSFMAKDGLSRRYATVTQVKADGTLMVAPDGSTGAIPCARACNPKVGDRVIILIDGSQWLAIGTIGGDDSGDPLVYINSGTHDMNNYRVAGASGVRHYFFGTGATLLNIPDGTNGWLIAIDNSAASNNASAWGIGAKQIWSRAGTPGTNDWRTFIRTYNGTSWGAWTRLLTSGDAELSYTTSEQDTGKVWIDGKPIYRRVFTGTITAAAQAHIQTTLLPLTASHTHNIIGYGGQWVYGAGGECAMIVGMSYDSSGGYGSALINRKNSTPYGISLVTFSHNARTNSPYQVWVEYTK